MTVTIKDDPKVHSIITWQSNKIAMILAMVGECTCTKKASTWYTCTRHRGDVNNERMKRAAKTQNGVKLRDVKWQVFRFL